MVPWGDGKNQLRDLPLVSGELGQKNELERGRLALSYVVG